MELTPTHRKIISTYLTRKEIDNPGQYNAWVNFKFQHFMKDLNLTFDLIKYDDKYYFKHNGIIFREIKIINSTTWDWDIKIEVVDSIIFHNKRVVEVVDFLPRIINDDIMTSLKKYIILHL